MAKRFTTIFFIVLGIIAFLGVGLFLVLILAPGTRIFGMMYVANNARSYSSGRLNVITELEKQGFSGFSGSVTIEASEIPIYIEYTERYVYEFEYFENYIGLTKTDIEKPSFTLSKDKLGGLVVKINGFEKFIFENKATVRYFKLYVPMVDVSGGGSGDTNLTITSVKSNITFYKTLGDGETRIPNFNTVSIETNGKIVLNGPTKAKTYKLKSPNTIKIDKDFKNVVEATHYNLESTKGKIIIEPAISGDLNLKTKNGSIKLTSCRNLTVNTEHGDIVGLDEDGKIDVLPAWKLLHQILLNYFEEIETTDFHGGYVQTAWQYKTFTMSDRQIRNRVTIRDISTPSKVAFQIKVSSEVAGARAAQHGEFEEIDRIPKEFETIIQELQTRVGKSHN